MADRAWWKKERNEPRDHLADDDDNDDVPQKENDHNNNEQASNILGASTRVLLIQSLILLQKLK